MEVRSSYPKPEYRDVISRIEILDVKNGERRVMQEFDYLVEAPNWSPDGKSLVYNSKGRIFSLDLSTGHSFLIDTAFADECNNDHLLSPDGKRLAVSHRTWEDNRSRIYTLPAKGGNPELITPMGPSYLHGWSPDGKTLTYSGERNGAWDIYSIPVRGGRETRLTDGRGRNDGCEYSPCGRYIWYNSTRSGLMQVWRMTKNGENHTRMTVDDSNNWFPHLSPDGELVSFLRYRKEDVDPEDHPANKDVEIRLMPSKGGPPVTITGLFGGQGTINVNSWSPDSRFLAFVSYRMKA